MAISDLEEVISPECARKCFLTGLSDGLPDCRNASVFTVSFIVATIVDLICLFSSLHILGLVYSDNCHIMP